MIPIRDLQIGNRVLYNGMEAIVYSIRGAYPSVDPKFNNKASVDLILGGLITATEEEIDPIVLTDEVMQKCGFKKFSHILNENNKASDSYYNLNLEILWFPFCYIRGINFPFIPLAGKDIKTQYLHELQNLCKSLTKQDLIP